MSDVDEEVRRLLVDQIESFEKLELLSLVWRERCPWTPANASARLRVDEPLIDVALQELEAIALLRRTPAGYCFEPTLSPRAAAAERLCRLYEDDRLLVVNLLTSAAFDRIRSSAATAFADAFRVRKDPKGGDRG